MQGSRRTRKEKKEGAMKTRWGHWSRELRRRSIALGIAGILILGVAGLLALIILDTVIL